MPIKVGIVSIFMPFNYAVSLRSRNLRKIKSFAVIIVSLQCTDAVVG